MYCSNCGAPLTEKDAKCPYCGTLNHLVAEAEYMEKLEDIREDTEDLAEAAPEEYTQQLKRHSKFALKISLSVIGICLTLFLIVQGVILFQSMHEKKEIHQQMVFEKEYFPVLDELYSAGDDEKVYEYLMDLYDKDGSDALFSWKHEAFYYYYGHYQDVRRLIDQTESGSPVPEDLSYEFYCALQLAVEGVNKFDRERITEEDMKKIDTFRDDSMKVLNETFRLTAAEAEQIYKECSEDGYLSYPLCKKYLEKHQIN